jgi:hypothetical protein
MTTDENATQLRRESRPRRRRARCWMSRMPGKIWQPGSRWPSTPPGGPVFDGMRGSHASAGIANAKLFRGSEDTLVVLADIPNFRDAMAWAEGGWRTAIPADEVEGPPAVYFGADPGQEAAEGEAAFDASQVPLKLMAHFKVYDYAKWHELFLKM